MTTEKNIGMTIVDLDQEFIPEIYHLRYGMTMNRTNTKRFIIARVNTHENPLVFVRWVKYSDQTSYDYGLPRYDLYENAMTAEQADEILECLKNNQKQKAKGLVKQYFKKEGMLVEEATRNMLDDMVPDSWYDVWMEMKDSIYEDENIVGYWEFDVEERSPF